MEENYLMAYDATTGNILGFYLKSIHGDNILTPNLEITQEKHDFYMEHNGQYRLNITTLEDELIPIIVIPTEKTELEILQENQILIQKAIDDLIFGGAL